MTIYINHNNPQAVQDLKITLIQNGHVEQSSAGMVAAWIISDRVVAWGGFHFVHLG